jgi:glucose-1-phosphate cytidylyltransferase
MERLLDLLMTQAKPLKTVILCGGLGTRLREETEYRPKPMVDVGGKPIVWHIMKMCAHYNLADFILCLGYKGQMFKEYFLSYEAMNNDFTIALGQKMRIDYLGHHDEQDYRVTLADTGIETMTGGRIKRIRKYVGDETFVVTYGDGLADVNLDKLVAFHRAHGKIATVTAVAPPSRYGVLQIADSGAVERFMEKPQQESRVSAGFFVFNAPIFDYLSGDDCIMEHAPLERLAKEGELMAYRHDGFFYAMDTYREYLALNEMWSTGAAPWKVW